MGIYRGGSWSGSPETWTLLPGSGDITAVIGDQWCGWSASHAAIWVGPDHTLVDLNLPGYDGSIVNASTGDTQAGAHYELVTGRGRATVWHGTAASAVILQPPGAYDSVALAADGAYQGGWVRYPNSAGQPGQYHAAVWAGTAGSFIDLTPSGHLGAGITGMTAGQLVGVVDGHAALWPSLTSPYIDLNPPGVTGAEAYATCGLAQVGVAVTPDYGSNAVIWFGSAQSMVELGPFLGPDYRPSVATCVAQQDGVFYVGGCAVNIATDRTEAVMWIGVPDPCPLAPFAAAALLASSRHRPR